MRKPHSLSRRQTLAIAAAAFLPMAPLAVLAQAAWPSKPIRLVIPSAPGGGTDAIGRVLADTLSTQLKQQVVPENRAGASGVVGSELVARAPADGYTIMIVQNGHSMNPAMYKKLPYDTFADFTPLTTLARTPLVLVASSATGVKTLKELIEFGKRNPAGMSFAAAEASTRLAIELLSDAIGIPVTVANYKGTGPAVTDVAGGHVNFTVTTIASTLAQRGGGKITYLGVLAGERASALPDVPTLAEQGQSGLEATGWWGMLAPPNLPKPLQADLLAAIRTAMANPEVRKRLTTLAADPWMGSPDDFDKFIRREAAQTIRLAKKAGIEPE
jgi:tripartite-type tricarboxylate transporter receptor subunit TctC